MQPMQLAIAQAQLAQNAGEIPVGAVVISPSGEVLASAHNLVETTANPTAHAELLALTQAIEKTGNKYLEGCTLAVTLEPCAMCAAAAAHARIATVIYGAHDPKSGGTENGARVFQHSHHKPQVMGGIMEAECRQMLQTFFANLRT